MSLEREKMPSLFTFLWYKKKELPVEKTGHMDLLQLNAKITVLLANKVDWNISNSNNLVFLTIN